MSDPALSMSDEAVSAASVDSIELTEKGLAAVERGHLNREQAAAAFAPIGPLLTIGPPGTGKTKTAEWRVSHWLDEGLDPERMVLISYTKKGAANLVDRVSQRAGKRLKFRGSDTISRFGLGLLREIGPRYGLPTNYETLSDKALRDFLATLNIGSAPPIERTKDDADSGVGGDVGWHGAGFGGDEVFEMGTPAANPLEAMIGGARPASLLLGGVEGLSPANIFARWQSRLIWPEDALRIAAGAEYAGERYLPDDRYVRIAEDYKKYKKALREIRYADGKGALDFTDHYTLPVHILMSDEGIRKWVQSGIHGVIADEYQDANQATCTFIHLLAGGNNVSGFGDPDQSIFSFMGGEQGNILAFRDHYPGGRVIALKENFRSRPVVVEISNRLIRNNVDRYETFMVAARKDEPLPEALGKALTAGIGKGASRPSRCSRAEVVAYTSDQEEAEDTARKIAALVAAGVPTSEIAILNRQARRATWLLLRLRAHGLPVRVVGGNNFEDPPEVRMLEGVIKAAWRGITDANQPGGPEVLALFGRAGGRAMLTKAKDLADRGLGVPARWEDLCAAAGEVVVAACPLDKRKGESLLWFDRARAAAAAATAAGTFDRWVGGGTVAAREDRGEGVTIGSFSAVIGGSFHGAKGLEFDHVFMPGCEADVCPAGEDTASEEERRLFYVGLSRAKETVTVSWASNRVGFRRGRRTPYVEECLKGTPGVTFVDIAPSAAPAPPAAPTGADIFASAPATPHMAILRPARPSFADKPRRALDTPTAPSAPAPTLTPVPQASRPPQAAPVPAPSVLRFGLAASRASTGTVWEIALLEKSGDKPLFSRLVNNEGDLMALIEGREAGIEMDALTGAETVAVVLDEIVAYLLDITEAAPASLLVSDHLLLDGPIAKLLKLYAGNGKTKAVEALRLERGPARPSGRATDAARAMLAGA